MHFSTLKIPFKILRGLDWGYSYKMSAPLWLGGIWQSGIVKQSWCKDILVMRMSEFYKVIVTKLSNIMLFCQTGR